MLPYSPVRPVYYTVLCLLVLGVYRHLQNSGTPIARLLASTTCNIALTQAITIRVCKQWPERKVKLQVSLQRQYKPETDFAQYSAPYAGSSFPSQISTCTSTCNVLARLQPDLPLPLQRVIWKPRPSSETQDQDRRSNARLRAVKGLRVRNEGRVRIRFKLLMRTFWGRLQ